MSDKNELLGYLAVEPSYWGIQHPQDVEFFLYCGLTNIFQACLPHNWIRMINWSRKTGHVEFSYFTHQEYDGIRKNDSRLEKLVKDRNNMFQIIGKEKQRLTEKQCKHVITKLMTTNFFDDKPHVDNVKLLNLSNEEPMIYSNKFNSIEIVKKTI